MVLRPDIPAVVYECVGLGRHGEEDGRPGRSTTADQGTDVEIEVTRPARSAHQVCDVLLDLVVGEDLVCQLPQAHDVLGSDDRIDVQVGSGAGHPL